MALEKDIREHKERVTQLEGISPVDNNREIELLKQLIGEKEKELEQFSPQTMNAELVKVDAQSGLPLEVREIIKDELGIEEEEKQIAQEADEIKKEIYIKESLQQTNDGIGAIEKDILSESNAERSFFGKTESVEEKVQKIQELFSNLDTRELEREDIETHARGWNVTNNIKNIGQFKERLIEHISNKNTYDWGIGEVLNFKELLHQKEFQDIIWISSSVDPRVLTDYQGNKKFNAFIQERPEFLESSEFRKVRLHLIKEGIKQSTLFEGYVHTQPEKFPEIKIDFFEEENTWNKYHLMDEEGGVRGIVNKNKKEKRKSLRSKEKPYIIDLDKYKYDISNIDDLSNEEKKEIKAAFIEKISRNMYTPSSSERIFAEEIFKTGKKLGVTEDEVDQYVYKTMIQGIASSYPPANGIDKEFGVVYKKIQETLTDLEKRKGIIDSLQKNIKVSDMRFDGWKESLNYVNINKEEKEAIVSSYLDFSEGERFIEKQRCIFGYPWTDEADLPFSKEQKLLAFSTMNTEQRSCLIAEYDKHISKLDFLPFTQADILEFGVNSIQSQGYINQNDIENIQKNIQKNFPDISISNAEIAKRVIFKNQKSIGDIEGSLERINMEMSPSEIVGQFNSPEDFIRNQIEGAELYKLKKLETFKSNPDTPELPYLSVELYAEIKKHILSTSSDSHYGDIKRSLKELISFIPKQYKLSMFADPDLQRAFSDYYEDALKKDNYWEDRRFIQDLRFLIGKSENLNNSEQKVFDEYLEEKDYFNLTKYYKTLQTSNVSSPTIQKIENLFKDRINEYGVNTEEIVLNSNTLEKTVKDTSEKKLNQLTPENLENEALVQEWFNIHYGSDSKKIFSVFNIVKNLKDFSYFDKKIKNNLFEGTLSDKFVGTLQKSVENNPESIDRTVEFIKDVRDIFDSNFILKNYDFLYKILSGLDLEEYKEKIKLLEKVRPSLYSPLISKISFEKIFTEVSSYDQKNKEIFFDLNDTPTYRIDSGNDLSWAKNTILYVNEVEEYGVLHRDQNKKDKMVDLFSGDYKNTALREMTGEWKDFLKSDVNLLPPQIRLVSKIIDEAGGAGNMKHIESLGNLISQIQSTLDNKKTTDGTIQEIKTMLSALENRFSKEKWSQDDISEFYNLSKDILEAAPSLYSVFSPIFEQMSAKDLKVFMKEVFPFYQTQLVIVQEIDGEEVKYKPRDLVGVRQSLKDFADKIGQPAEDKKAMFAEEKSRLLEIVKGGFKDRFGLMKVPDEFSKEDLRSIQNGIRYIGNISVRSAEREAIIAFYLGLELNGEWEAFRGGKEVKLDDYFSGKQLAILKPLIEEKMKGYEAVETFAGISKEQMPRFQEILQEDTISNMMGNIQTVDVKLGNIKRNVEELADPDTYEQQQDKDVMKLLMEEGRSVGSILAKTYGQVSGKSIEITEEEKALQLKLAGIFGVGAWNAKEVKRIQDTIQPFSLVSNMINKMSEERVDENIQELQKRLTPNEKIIQIFNRLGEEFKQESGALALSKDITYLESLMVKDDKKLTDEEKTEVKSYLDSIKEKMKDLEGTLDKVRGYFDKIRKGSHLENHELLKNRLADIEKIIHSTDSNAMIVSRMTKDLNFIIENMRQCLGCMRKEANNDTNLAFGDYNKFFMINQAEKEKGSISDEIVFFLPIQTPDGRQEMSFVLDRVYGSKSPDVLLGNILSIHKKYQALKKEIPDARISITISNAAMGSVGLDSELLQKQVGKIINNIKSMETFENVTTNVPKSAFSDNYIEFGGGGARQSGERVFSGLILR